ncbi:hypothetical protein [uncultured Microscilla sp.]|uniref:hypothetical protein n=1 Tax=uncultured Microscilla sp. TaxID=432653 RepID=UPI002601634A|nr:hypothetical protein [uncultured Microscilla sp.]
MRYLKLDRLSNDGEHEIASNYAFTSFVEIDDDGYEKRRLSFYRSNDEGDNGQYIGFMDGQKQYMGTCMAEVAHKEENYSKTGVFQIDKYQDEAGFSINFTVEISKDSFEQVWETVVDKYLFEECNAELDEEPLIDFNKLPEIFNDEQLEYLAETYTHYKDDIPESHLKQVLDYIAKKQG